MFGMLGRFLPAAGGAVLMPPTRYCSASAPCSVGCSCSTSASARSPTRRQAARTQVRQFLDDVQFEVGNEIASRIRDLQRTLRDEFSERLGELQRTYTDTAQQAQAGRPDAASTETQARCQPRSQARLAELDQVGRASAPRRVRSGDRSRAPRAPRPCRRSSSSSAVAARGGRRRFAVRGAGRRDPRPPRRAAARRHRRSRQGRASPRCSTHSSASAWRRPTPASARRS